MGARLAGVPVVVRTEHSLHYPGRHSALYPLLERLATVLTRRVVCVCRAVLESHVRRLPWATRRFVTVANGIASAPHTRPREEVRAALGLEPAAAVVLTVGSLTRQKAQHVLIEAFALAARTRPAARLLVAGEGPLRPALEARIAALGAGRSVTLLGPRADVAELMVAGDVFALSSVREGLSVTLLEAMRAGRAAVVTDIGGCAEAVEDGVTGRVTPVDDVAALAAALGELLDDAPRRAAMGAAARARWEQRFTAERMVRETEAVYREALAETGHAASAPRGGRDAAARAGRDDAAHPRRRGRRGGDRPAARVRARARRGRAARRRGPGIRRRRPGAREPRVPGGRARLGRARALGGVLARARRARGAGARRRAAWSRSPTIT